MKAVAPTGDEFIIIELPATVLDQVSVMGEKLSVVRPDGHRQLHGYRPADCDDQQRDAGIYPGPGAQAGAG